MKRNYILISKLDGKWRSFLYSDFGCMVIFEDLKKDKVIKYTVEYAKEHNFTIKEFEKQDKSISCGKARFDGIKQRPVSIRPNVHPSGVIKDKEKGK